MEFFDKYDDIERAFSPAYDKCIIGYCQNTLKPIYSANKLIKALEKEGHYYFSAKDIVNTNVNDDAIICIDYE